MPGQAAGDSPGFIAPMLATAAAGLPPDAAEFVAEAKWDGLRACVAVAGGRVRVWSRTGRDHLDRSPYVLRRALLEDLGLEVPGSVQVPPAFPGEAAALLAATRDRGLEGIILKRPGSLYHPGRRTREWLKIRNIRAADVRVGGWLPGTGTRA